MKEQDKNRVRDLSEMVISNKTDNEIKVMIMKTLTGLERRVEDISETTEKEMRV